MTRSKLQHRVDALSSVLDSLKPGLAADLQVADKEALVRCNLVTRSALLSSDTAELDACGVDRSARDAILKAQQNKNTWRWNSRLMKEVISLKSICTAVWGLSWANSVTLGAVSAYTIYSIVRDDILAASEVQGAEGNPLIYGLKVEKLVTTANVRAVLGLTSLLLTTLYIDQSYDGLWVLLGLLGMVVAVVLGILSILFLLMYYLLQACKLVQ